MKMQPQCVLKLKPTLEQWMANGQESGTAKSSTVPWRKSHLLNQSSIVPRPTTRTQSSLEEEPANVSAVHTSVPTINPGHFNASSRTDDYVEIEKEDNLPKTVPEIKSSFNDQNNENCCVC